MLIDRPLLSIETPEPERLKFYVVSKMVLSSSTLGWLVRAERVAKHQRIHPYTLIRLASRGVNLVLHSATNHGRPCIPQNMMVCSPLPWSRCFFFNFVNSMNSSEFSRHERFSELFQYSFPNMYTTCMTCLHTPSPLLSHQ